MDSKTNNQVFKNEIKKFLRFSHELNDNLIPLLDYKFTLKEIIVIMQSKGQGQGVTDVPSDLAESFIGIENQDAAVNNIRALTQSAIVEVMDGIIATAKASDLKNQNGYRIME